MILVVMDDCYRCEIFMRRNLADNILKRSTGEDTFIIRTVPEITGLGDNISKFLSKIGFKSCRFCKVRQSFLNYLFPNRKVEKYLYDLKQKVLKTGEKYYPVLLKDGKAVDLNEYDPGFEAAVKKYEEEHGVSVD